MFVHLRIALTRTVCYGRKAKGSEGGRERGRDGGRDDTIEMMRRVEVKKGERKQQVTLRGNMGTWEMNMKNSRVDGAGDIRFGQEISLGRRRTEETETQPVIFLEKQQGNPLRIMFSPSIEIPGVTLG